MDYAPEVSLIEFIRYNNWANQQVLAVCEALSQEQLDTAIPGAFGTVRDTLAHIVRAEADYVGRMTGHEPQPPFKWEDKPSIADVAAFADVVGDAMLDAAQRISPSAMVRETWQGLYVQYEALALYIQTVNHGIEHRTNITTLLSQAGHKLPDVDGWGYMWSHTIRFQAEEGKEETAEASD